MASIAHDSKLVAGLITSLGGRVVEGQSLRFDLPLRDVEKVIPRLNSMGVGCRRVHEWTETDHRGPHSVVRIACTDTPAGTVRGYVENSTLAKFGF